MEFLKKNIHMERTKCRMSSQITLEEDRNISDRQPDAAVILMDQGRVAIDEVRPGKDGVIVKGRYCYDVLYQSEEEGRLCAIRGELPFDEKIRLDAADIGDTYQCTGEVEHRSIGLINSRKISIRVLLNLCVRAEELYSQEIIEDVADIKNMEIRKEALEESFLRIQKNDVFRLKEEIQLPGNLPGITEPLWNCGHPGKVEIRPLEDAIGIKGELEVFFLYEGEGEERPIRFYQTVLPFSGNLECIGSREDMVEDIVPELAVWNVNVKPDYDGEDRILEIEMVLNLPIRLLETQEVQIVSDVYGIRQSVQPRFEKVECRKLQQRLNAKLKKVESVKLSPSDPRISQICHLENKAVIEEVERTEKGLEITGVIETCILYITGEEATPYYSKKAAIPFQTQFDLPELGDKDTWRLHAVLEHCEGIILDGETIEWKGTVLLEGMLWRHWEQPVMTTVLIEDEDTQSTCKKMPGMVVYVADGGETIWNVGKKYRAPLEPIRSLNQLTEDELQRGQKILIVKEVL
ncbi:MAG: DUF3794 domain-containing protein [Lachnospiraceae bacterium]|nr:DUF3794 domain-containing protein [Lachnospiraceae bacterium]